MARPKGIPFSHPNFWEKRIKHLLVPTSNGCWEWTGGTNKTGYGRINVCGQIHLVHRLMYFLYKGPIPDGLCVCHSCDTPNCCNPEHLWLGTATDNFKDMWAKGRARNGKDRPYCAHGHPYTPENTYIDKRGYRVCRTCQKLPTRGPGRTHCKKGHIQIGDSIHVNKYGQKSCAICKRVREITYAEKKRREKQC